MKNEIRFTLKSKQRPKLAQEIWIYRCAESACPVFWKSPVRKEEITVPDR